MPQLDCCVQGHQMLLLLYHAHAYRCSPRMSSLSVASLLNFHPLAIKTVLRISNPCTDCFYQVSASCSLLFYGLLPWSGKLRSTLWMLNLQEAEERRSAKQHHEFPVVISPFWVKVVLSTSSQWGLKPASKQHRIEWGLERKYSSLIPKFQR